jgi:hypothetical protein
MRPRKTPRTRRDSIADAIGLGVIASEVIVVICFYWRAISSDLPTADHPVLYVLFLFAAPFSFFSAVAIYAWRNFKYWTTLSQCFVAFVAGLVLLALGFAGNDHHWNGSYKLFGAGLILISNSLAQAARLQWLISSSPERRLLGSWETAPDDTDGMAKYGFVRMRFSPDGSLMYSVREAGGARRFMMSYAAEGNILRTQQAGAEKDGIASFQIADDGTLILNQQGVKSRYRRA